METSDQAARPYDFVIFGASGFTGKYVIREAIKFLYAPTSPLKSMAIAGRSSSKLAEALNWATNNSPPPNIPIITADVSDPTSLLALCAKTKLILNCVGPYRLYGAPVVAACIQTATDYLDISGEPEFIERTEIEYHEKAKECGSLIVSACGFDSIPAELGVMFNARQWGNPSAPNRIEAYVSLESEKRIVGNHATYESAVLGVANVGNLQALRRLRPKRARPMIPGSPPKGKSLGYNKEINQWAIKLPSADSVVVRRTLSSLAENPSGLAGVEETSEQLERRTAFWATVKPAHFGVKMASTSLLSILRLIMIGLFIGLLANFDLGRMVLLKFPSFFSLGTFSKKGPSEEEVEVASFKMWFVGEGYSDCNNVSGRCDAKVVTRVSGPEIGYVTTPIVLVQCALVVLCQRKSLPKGGVYSPGIVFGPTDLQQRLQENGVSFDVVSKVGVPN